MSTAGTRFHVGTSGFSYDEWRPAFYPEDLAKDAMLSFYASQLRAVELNNTFYRMPSEKACATWRAQVGDDFRFAVKASKRITWSNKLVDCGELLDVLARVVRPLGETLGCVFYQLPKWVRKDCALLRDFLALPQPCPRVAFEFAHAGWLEDDAIAVLREHNAALVLSDRDDAAEPQFFDTADWAYLRLRRTGYDDDVLARWRDRLLQRGFADVFLFFKHEDSCAGPALARRFVDLV